MIMRLYSLAIFSLLLSSSAFAMMEADELSAHTTAHSHTVQKQDKGDSSSHSSAAAAAAVSPHPGGRWEMFPSSEQPGMISNLWMVRCLRCETWLLSTQNTVGPSEKMMPPTNPMIRRHVLLDCKIITNASSATKQSQGSGAITASAPGVVAGKTSKKAVSAKSKK
jgi:hypothetical protein